ncbi:PDDEXK nuclease domain-containing protein [Algivirga pacifica]|uniref:PDDEXK nuclease domain-containing protein n=1 Tax=Algivirga pacifica TaxID=1162670 RepID=A0ABP9DPP3_9BACT
MVEYHHLLSDITNTLKEGQKQAVSQVNQTLVATYWKVGKYIIDFEQHGMQRAEYGTELISQLAKDLKTHFGRGFSKSTVYKIRQLYQCYPNFQTLSGKLSWSHYAELLSISDDTARSFYLKQCEYENWSVRELKRQRDTGLFERIALSKNKQEVIEISKKGHLPAQPKDLLKDPYVFEFLDLPNKEVVLEKDIEAALTDKLGHFLLELGKGFAFIGKQYRITIDNTHFYVDLVFYHRILKCFVLIDLKTGKVSHQDIGQMNLYLNYFRMEENTEGDNPPIGIVMGADKSDILVEYATAGIDNQLFVSKYQLYLPDKEVLEAELSHLLGRD